jgi:copper oxidase (laccase) domain-containing protein
VLLWDRIFPGNVFAGFTSSGFRGDVPAEMPGILEPVQNGPAIAWMDQVHGSDVVRVSRPGRYICDGLMTREPGLALVVRTADCLPLILYSEKEKIAGVIHMGWRSAEAGILENIEHDLSTFVCVAGVGLRRCCYEVGEDFLKLKRLRHFVGKKSQGYYFDPVAFALHHLTAKGLPARNFIEKGICSYCSKGAYHSVRKTGTSCRTLTFIVRT